MADILILFEKNKTVPMEITQAHVDQVKKAVGGDVFWCRSEKEALDQGIDAEVLFTWCGSGDLPETYCAKSKKLKWIHSFSAGVDPVMKSPLRQLPIRMTNSRGLHGKAMALTTIGYIISFLRHLPTLQRQQQSRVWNKPSDPLPGEAEGLTICILGAGSIGSELARLCKALGMYVVGVKRSVTPLEHYDEVLPSAEMDEAIARADFLVLSAPLTSETYHLMDATRIGKMKSSAILINIARGAIVDEPALIAALADKKIAGAALDALETEPLPADSPLWGMENVILTPHCSATSDRYMDRAFTQFCDLLGRYERGEPLYNEIDLS